jgi:predicted lipoprotein with Yx(FWY)xxD motif
MSTKDSLTRVATMLAAATLLAACGTSEGDAGSAGGEDPQQSNILVDTSGKTLYFTDQEEDGTIRCVDECLDFWIPAESQDAPEGDMPALDTKQRADNGQEQLTYEGKPLYTFTLDKAAGDAKGDGLEDDFGGTHFVWHAVTLGDAPAPGNGGDPGGTGY